MKQAGNDPCLAVGGASSTIIFSLRGAPWMTSAAPAIEAGNAGGAAGTPVKSARILLVEDNRDILRATQRILAARNYEILTAMDGEAALEIARKERPDVILLDIMIPKLDGLEVCRQIKKDP